MKVGIVLGAGGPVGWAYHLGVIDGIEKTLGCNPANADMIVGTSAGGAIAASLLAGASSDEVLAAINEPLSREEQDVMREARADVVRKPWRLLRPQSPRTLLAGGLVGLVGLVPAGVFPTFAIRRFPVEALDGWPEKLWLPSVELGSGETVVFGRDRLDVPVEDALEATSAVPGLFRPKRIGQNLYVDGAVASATHADLLGDFELDVVVISSPMTRPGNGIFKRRARRQLAAERESLEERGTAVVTISPTESIIETAAGFPRSNRDAGPAIVDAASAHTTEVLVALGD